METLTIQVPKNRKREFVELVEASGYAKVVGLKELVEQLSALPGTDADVTDEEIDELLQKESKAYRLEKARPRQKTPRRV